MVFFILFIFHFHFIFSMADLNFTDMLDSKFPGGSLTFESNRQR